VSARRARNEDVADALERVADLLEAQGENPYRVRAWRAGAQTVKSHAGSVAELLEREGTDGLDRLPGIGKSLAGAIAELVHTGRLRMLDRLEGEISPEDLFTTVPGIGEELARRVHDHLHVDTLEELELAAHDARLAVVPGFGPRRVWLPVLHTEREGRSFTALFSNTARAHELGLTRDWVILYHERDGDEDQCTVVTERHGPLAGRRVVRGREEECAAHDRATGARRAAPPSPLASAERGRDPGTGHAPP